MGKRIPLLERFKRHVERGKSCWLWTGNRNQAGYGQLRLGRRGGTVSAHRLAWQLFRGPIPDGLIVCHHCDNPSCVNPDHLFVGTHKDNAQDMIAKGRRAKSHRPHTRHRKLTDDQVRSIRADDRKVFDIAMDYGVSDACVYGIKSRRRKAMVPECGQKPAH